MDKVLITGGLGYLGTELSKFLANRGYKVKIIDIGYFNNKLGTNNKNIKVIKKDLNNINVNDLKGFKKIIHLAAISNDPAALLNSKITWETNVLSTLKLLEICKISKIQQFIFVSSGSVYGVSKKKKVDENTELLPLSDYNKTKMVGEKIVNNYKDFFNTVILRPGTICGVSDSMRLDLTVNAMTYSALTKKIITVNGGNQIRPQVHIKDMLNIFLFFLKRKKIQGVFNIGFENYSILKVAKMIKKKLKFSTINIKKEFDIRSYRLYSKKILKKGFKHNFKVEDAISDIAEVYYDRKLNNSKQCYRTSYLSKKLQK
tara:strand:+ start:971 stop:1918 length:948 start_codon:yes stop_codon:yes gene_type:complete